MESRLRERASTKTLRERFADIRQTSCTLAEPLSAEDQTVQSMEDASPTKWHLAHASWFFETFVLRPHLPHYPIFDVAYETLFNSYYNAVGNPFPRPHRGLLSRPGVEEVMSYRRHVDEAMQRLLTEAEAHPAADGSRPILELTELGLHHEQQHQELLLTDIKHALFQNPLYPAYKAHPTGPTAPTSGVELRKPPPLEYAGFNGGIVEIGHPGDTEFCYDNETPRHRALLEDFELARRPLCNADVLTFIEAGGYEDPLLWLSDGWAWKTRQQVRHPLYFVPREDGAYQEFTLRGLEPLEPARIACHLTYFEADAMARFFGARLPTEQEWERASEMQSLEGEFSDTNVLHPRLVPTETGNDGNDGNDGLFAMFGSVWEWTRSPYVPYPGYAPAKGAVGEYNGKFMHNQMVLRGGSCVTPPGHVRRTYRNFFPGSAQWQFTGVRLAR